MQPAKPHTEHEWPQKLVGELTFEAEATVAPGKPPEKARAPSVFGRSEGFGPSPRDAVARQVAAPGRR